jgi:hypothetical protein
MQPASQRPRRKFRRFALSGSLLGVATYLYVNFSALILLGLIGLGITSALLAPVAKRRGWFSEGRLNALLSRPGFEDSAKRRSASF